MYKADNNLAEILKENGLREIPGVTRSSIYGLPIEKNRRFIYNSIGNRIVFEEGMILLFVNHYLSGMDMRVELSREELISVIAFYKATKPLQKYCKDFLNGIPELHLEYHLHVAVYVKQNKRLREKLISHFEKTRLSFRI